MSRVRCVLLGGPADGLVSDFEPEELIEVRIFGPMRPPVIYRFEDRPYGKLADPLFYRYAPEQTKR